MDINEIGGGTTPTGLTKTLKKEDNHSFRDVLRVRVAQSTPAPFTTGPESKSAFLDQSEKVLALLDDFAQALADPRRSLRDMAPLVQRMEGEVRRLETASGNEGVQGARLSHLVNEVSLLTNVTLVKFHRGDFI